MADLWPITDEGRAGIERLLDQLRQVDEAVGGWTAKVDVRQTGVSYHAKFDRKTDVLGGASLFVTMIEKSPALLADACRRLLAADDAHRAVKP